MSNMIDHDSDDSPDYAEIDPTGRYGRVSFFF